MLWHDQMPKQSIVPWLTWIKQFLSDMGFKTQGPMKMFCDNNSARHIASNPMFHERTKHAYRSGLPLH